MDQSLIMAWLLAQLLLLLVGNIASKEIPFKFV